MVTHDPILDHQARIERERLDAAERRDRALIDQRSPDLSAAARIAVWEKLHQVRLPKDPAHPILPKVAKLTALQLAEVLEVQRERAQAAAPPQT